jgi:hypothetical protein
MRAFLIRPAIGNFAPKAAVCPRHLGFTDLSTH